MFRIHSSPRFLLLFLLFCFWQSCGLLPSMAQEVDVDKDEALQEKLQGLKKRLFSSVQLSDLEEKFPASGDARLRRAAIHKVRKFFPDDVKHQTDCAILELDLDFAENKFKLLGEHLAQFLKSYQTQLTPGQVAQSDFFQAVVAQTENKMDLAITLLTKVTKNKKGNDQLRMTSFRYLAEVYISQSKPAEAAKVLAEGTKSLDAGVAPFLEPIKAGVLLMLGQKDQAQRVWKQCAENYGANSAPIYNTGIQMLNRPIWQPVGDELLTVMVASVKKLPFAGEMEKMAEDLRKKLKEVGKGGLMLLAKNQEQQGQYEQALATYSKVPASDPLFLFVNYRRSLLLGELGRMPEALQGLAALGRISIPVVALKTKLTNEAQSFLRQGTEPLETYGRRSVEWWGLWGKVAESLALKTPDPKRLGYHLNAELKGKGSDALAVLARWTRWNPLESVAFAQELKEAVTGHPAAVVPARQMLLALERAMPEQAILIRANLIKVAFNLTLPDKPDGVEQVLVALAQDYLKLELTREDHAYFISNLWHSGVLALLDDSLQESATTRLDALINSPSGLGAEAVKSMRQLLSLIYLAQGKTAESESVLLQDQAWPLPTELQAFSELLKSKSKPEWAQLPVLKKQTPKQTAPDLPSISSLLSGEDEETPAEAIPQAGPYGPALKATMAQVQPVWYEFISPDSVRDSSIRDEKKFFGTDGPELPLWSRFKGCLLYAADPEKTQEIRRSSVLSAAAWAYQSSRTLTRLQPWLNLSLTKSMNDPLNYSVEMKFVDLAIAQGAPAVAEQFMSPLRSSASQKVHDSRLDPFVKQNDYFLEMYRLEPDEASVTAFQKKIMVTPLENDRAQLIAPTMTFLLNHGLTKAAAAWREAALAAVAKDKENVKQVAKLLDGVASQSNTWRPIHEALCEVLWKHIDIATVTKPREVDDILNQSIVGTEYPPETLRQIYCYYLKKGGLFWQQSHWQHLLGDALPNDEKWLPLKRELCAKAIEVAPTDELRLSFARYFPHYFPLHEAPSREFLKNLVKPFQDLKKYPFMGQMARWTDFYTAMATMDETAMETINNLPADTSEPLERHWRTVALLTGRGQKKDVENMLKDLPENAYLPYNHQATMVRAMKLIEDEKRLAKVSKLARASAKDLLGRIWVNRDLDQLPMLIDLVDALDEKELLPAPFIKEMRAHPYLPVSAPASAWFYTMDKSWSDAKSAAELALKITEGDTVHQPLMLLLLGFAEANLGNKEAAAKALEAFLQQAPASIHWKAASTLLQQVGE
jgi:tetratricopeptide (TPR) repeat protein